jgi:hypothetical protein
VEVQPKQPTAKGPAEWFTAHVWIDGAAPAHFMTHLSITEAVGGDERPELDWAEHVSDDEYQQRRR